MASLGNERDGSVPIIDLSRAPQERGSWGRSALTVAIWVVIEALLVTNPLQVSSRLRVMVLRLFGARIGRGVIFRPRTRVKFPWKLSVGDRSWIGEGVWFHNQETVTVGHDVVISQDTFVTTGSHRVRGDMGLITKSVDIAPGAWITSRCVVLGGTRFGVSAVARPNTVIKGVVPANSVVAGPDCIVVGARFSASDE